MTHIVFADLKVGLLGGCSSINAGTNRIIGRRNVSLANEAQGGVTGDGNVFRHNAFGLQNSQAVDDAWGGKSGCGEVRK